MHLITPRLILRDFVIDDWPAVYDYQRDPRYLRFYDWEDRTEDEVSRFVQMFIDQQEQRPRTRYQLAVTLQSDGRLIGNAGIRLAVAGAAEAEIGYEVRPDEWGRGYATEAAREIVRFGFEELGVRRIAAWTVADNVASTRVLEKVGMTLVGRLPAKEHYKGRDWDVLMYAMERATKRQEKSNIMSQPKIDGTIYGFPAGMSQPALEALLHANITSLEQIAAMTPADLLKLHGVGPKTIRILRPALAAAGLSFAGEG